MGLGKYKEEIVQLGCQFMYAAVTLSSRAALLQQMSPRVFVVYRMTTAFLLIAPFAFFTRRENKNCSLGWKNFLSIFMLSFVGVTLYQNIYTEGLYLASSTAASALSNLVPVITLIIAYAMGLEKVQIGSMRSAAKIIGTVVCVVGAAAMTFLKGPKLLNMEAIQPSHSLFNLLGHDTWLLGCCLLFGSSCCWSLWLIFQVNVTANYPDHLSMTAWMCLFAAVQSGLLTVIVERDTKSWKLDSSLQICSCLYAGLSSAVTNFAQAWCISRRGPMFSAMFNPLFTVIVTLFASIFMGEQMYTASLAGAVAVVIGLYIVLWGKANDHAEPKEETLPMKQESDQAILVHDNNDLEVPFLHQRSQKL